MKTAVEISRSAVGPVPWLKLRGPRRDVFAALGQAFRDVIETFLARPHERERAARARRSPHLRPVLEETRTLLAGPVSELEAVAEGAEVPVEELLALNLRGDIGAVGEGCSDLALATHDRFFLAHNEDGDPVHEGDCPLLTLHVDGDLPLATYWYPGMLPAMTFWLNGAGLACGIDHVPVREPGRGVGRQFLARHLASTESVDEFVAVAVRTPVAGGYSYILGSARERRLASVEVGPGGVSVHEVAGRCAHTNHFLSLPDDQVVDARSVSRLQILNSIEETVTPGRALQAFTDSSGGIWRDATGGDPMLTLCTVVFDFDARVALLRPRGASEAHAVGFDELLSPPG